MPEEIFPIRPTIGLDWGDPFVRDCVQLQLPTTVLQASQRGSANTGRWRRDRRTGPIDRRHLSVAVTPRRLDERLGIGILRAYRRSRRRNVPSGFFRHDERRHVPDFL